MIFPLYWSFCSLDHFTLLKISGDFQRLLFSSVISILGITVGKVCILNLFKNNNDELIPSQGVDCPSQGVAQVIALRSKDSDLIPNRSRSIKADWCSWPISFYRHLTLAKVSNHSTNFYINAASLIKMVNIKHLIITNNILIKINLHYSLIF